MFQYVAKFADIAGKIMFQQQGIGFGGDTGDLEAMQSIQGVDEVIHEQRDILTTIHERGDIQADDTDSVIQVFPEGSLLYKIR